MLKSKILLRVCSFLLIVGVGVGLWDPFALVHAQSVILEDIGKVMAMLIDLILFVVVLCIEITGPLFGTEYLTSQTFLDEAIRPMWVFVRNLVNLMFVGVIIFIAMGNLYSSVTGGGNWTIKEKLPRLIAAMVLINFSLLGFVVMIDAVYVGTVAMFGISDTALNDKTAAYLLFDQNLCGEEALKNSAYKTEDECLAVLDKRRKFSGEPTFAKVVNSLMCNGDSSGEGDCKFFSLVKDKAESVTNDPKAPGRNVMAAVASQIMHVEALPLIAGSLGNGPEDIFALLNATVFSAVLSIAYVLGFVALLVGLLARTVFLWIAMIASPLIVADIVLGLGWIGSQKDKLLNTIIMPVKVAAAFAVSFVLVANVFTLKINENVTGFVKFNEGLTKFGTEGLGLLWQIATIMIFWFAIWAAMEKSVAEGMTNKIKGFGEKMGGLAVKGLGNIPVIPTGKTDKATGKDINVGLASITKADDLFAASVNQLEADNYKKLQEVYGGPQSADAKKAQKSLDGIRKAVESGRPFTATQAHDVVLEEMGGQMSNPQISSDEMIKKLHELGKQSGKGDFWTNKENIKEFKSNDPHRRATVLAKFTEGASGRGSAVERREAYKKGTESKTPDGGGQTGVDATLLRPEKGTPNTTKIDFGGANGRDKAPITIKKVNDNEWSSERLNEDDIADMLNKNPDEAIRNLFGDDAKPGEYVIEQGKDQILKIKFTGDDTAGAVPK